MNKCWPISVGAVGEGRGPCLASWKMT